MKPKVSVIIPVYGVEKYIERCARSLFEQTLDDIEYLFIDDCTPDRSIEILQNVLEDYTHRQSQVIIHRMEQNCGQAAVREWGIKNATGDYIIHCDSDDWLEKDAYLLMYNKAIEENADIVICDYQVTDGERILQVESGMIFEYKEEFLQSLFKSDKWSLCNKLFNRLTCYRDNIIYPCGNLGEDMVLCFQLLLNGRKVTYVPRPLYNYYYNNDSITKQTDDEKRLRNFRQNKLNVEVLIRIIDNRGASEIYSEGMNLLLWRIKKQLWQTSFNRRIYEIWKSTFPNLAKKVLLRKEIPLKEKVKYVILSSPFGYAMYRFLGSKRN